MGLTVPCLLSLPRIHTLVNFPFRTLSLRRRPPMHPLLGRSHLPQTTHNLLLLRTRATLRGLNKMVHKSRLHKKASAHVVIAVQAEVRVSADRHSAVVASRRACSSLPAVVGMGMALSYSYARAMVTTML